eukprot:7378164-Prymnesium_polylepis.1
MGGGSGASGAGADRRAEEETGKREGQARRIATAEEEGKRGGQPNGRRAKTTRAAPRRGCFGSRQRAATFSTPAPMPKILHVTVCWLHSAHSDSDSASTHCC